MNLLSRYTNSVTLCVRVLLASALLCLSTASLAQLTSTNFALVPPLITESAPPNVMLVLSNDHELYKKAYSDFTDIDNDGLVDSSYKDDFTYSGYFDSNFCYSYTTLGTDRYIPVSDISALIGTTGHSCLAVSGNWSGNFLNWASMSRMDIVRDVLFGGARETDTASGFLTAGETILERVYLPEDTHSFVKVFEGSTERYTPWNFASISLCSTTYGSDSSDPVMRVAEGAWPLWSSAEVVQCHYRSENGTDGGLQKPPTSDRPSGTYSFDVLVQVCIPGLDASSSRCKAYTDGGTGYITYKPIGLLQRYGDNSTISFGLLSGSYNEKISGGVLRKNIVPLTGNSDDSFNEIDLDDGTFKNQGPSDAGIINTISRFRIIDWNYGSNNYSDCNTHSIPVSTFKSSGSGNRQCRNWGNPLSEIYLEALRYFSGDNIPSGTAIPTGAFDTSDASHISSLPQLNWLDPLSNANSCASCSIIVLSTGLNSFDKDELGTVTDIWNDAGSTRMSTSSLDALLDSLGTLEGITGGSYLIGENGSSNDGSCNAKTINNLSDAQGICPEIPGLEGGYDIAGLAYHAYVGDLRSDFDGFQSVSTYSVALAQNLPSYELDVGGNTVTFVPTCQANTDGGHKLDESGWTNCSFVDAKIERQDAYGGSMYISWEDSLWGNDFDMDAVSRIEWCIGDDESLCPEEVDNANYTAGSGQNNFSYSDFDWKSSGLDTDTIQFRVSAPLAAAGNAIRLGFSISGVENEGTVSVKTNTPSAARNNNPKTTGSGGNTKYIARDFQGNGEQSFLLRQGGYNISRLVSNSGNRIIYHEPLVYTADPAVTTGKLLPNPLYFTAKYGSFNDIDGDGTPKYNNSSSDNREWDVKDVDGNEIPDGIPDNFFPITNPAQLSSSLTQVFDIITSRISSGTAAAVVANSSTGLGSVYQAYYHPQYTDGNNVSITWGGVLHAMFIDESGRFREDNGTPGQLDDPNTDYVVDIQFDSGASPARTRFQRYTQTGTGSAATLAPFGGKEDLEDFGSIWNARDVLANISQANMLTQRTINVGTRLYTENAASKRYIFTYLDSISSGTQGVVDASEVIDFTHTNFDPTNGTNNFRYLGLSNSGDAINLVKFTRGQDQAGWRSRLIDIPGDGTTADKYWVLGDIVHSSPLVVNPPSERYDLTNGDETYEAFKAQYQRRRQMIYTGGNDGMLHAFNGGIWNAAGKKFETRAYNTGTGLYDVGQAHTLGSEMWAYVPMNLLPHLQWLKENNYPHVYYMDGPPQSFDVNIFTADATHPSGWGTILVAGMRLGGGDFPVDLDGDSVDETTMTSAYVIFDITDPEQAPVLIAELTASDLGYTTGSPTLVKARVPSVAGSYTTPETNKWTLVFGSGPDTQATAVSNGQDAKLFAYDLVNRSLISIHSDAQTPSAEPSGFFGDFKAVDWQGDYIDDVIYVGTIEGSEVSPTGRVKRIVLDSTAADMGLSGGEAEMSELFDPAQPITARPNTQVSISKNERWVLFGTGRLFTTVDNRSTTLQSYYGIKEASDYDTSSLVYSQLVDSTDILVSKDDGLIHNGSLGVQVTRFSTNLDNYTELYNFMDARPGWVHDFDYSLGVSPSERVFNSSTLLGSTLIFTTYQPSVDLCIIEGNGYLYAFNFRTGTAESFGVFGEDPAYSGIAAESVNLGQGAPSAPSIITRTGDEVGVDGTSGSDVSIISGSTTGETNNQGGNLAPIQSGRMSWELLDIPF